MKLTAVLAILLGMAFSAFAQANIEDTYQPRDLAVDDRGNVYLAVLRGWFWSDYLTGFINKYDPTGKPLWSTQVGPVDSCSPFHLALDEDLGVYAAGNGRDGQFVTYVKSDGARLWSAKILSTSEVLRLQVRSAGRLEMISSASSSGGDLLISLFDRTGRLRKRSQFGKIDHQEGRIPLRTGIADTDGNLLLAGRRDYGTLLLKWRDDGSEIWTKKTDVKTDWLAAVDDGTFCLGGWVEGHGARVSKHGANGELIWQTSPSFEDASNITDIAVDWRGNAYGTGSIDRHNTGENGPDNVEELFVMKLNPKGRELWSSRCGVRVGLLQAHLALDRAGNSYVTTDNIHYQKTGPFLAKYSPDGRRLPFNTASSLIRQPWIIIGLLAWPVLVLLGILLSQQRRG